MAKRRRQPQAGQRPATDRGQAQQGAAPQPAPRRPAPTRPPRGRATAKPRGLLGGADPIRVGIVFGVVLAVGVLLVAVVFGGGGVGPHTCGQMLAPGGSPEDGQVTANMGRLHVARGSPLSYLFCPPTSGTHYDNESGFSPARPGFYRPDAAIGPGSWIHNLEHGYVVVLYRCAEGLCPSEEVLTEIRRFVNNGPQTPVAANCGIRSKMVAARFDDMSTPFALLTWDRVSLLESFDVDTAQTFANRWMEKTGPEAASC